MVGAIAISRAMPDGKEADQALDSALQTAMGADRCKIASRSPSAPAAGNQRAEPIAGGMIGRHGMVPRLVPARWLPAAGADGISMLFCSDQRHGGLQRRIERLVCSLPSGMAVRSLSHRP